MTDRASRVRKIAVITCLSAQVLAACSLRPPVTDRTAPPPATTTTPNSTTTQQFDLAALLPLSTPDLNAALHLTITFAAVYGTYRYDQPPQNHLVRLRPMATAELNGALARAAATPTIHAQRTRDREVATAHASVDKIRTIGPASLVVITHLRQDITTVSGRLQRTQRLALTAAKTGKGGWLIHDLQPAQAGDHGDTDAGP
jgi:hypothetical protein